MVYLTVGGEKITTTTEHPFYVKGKGWVRAKKLLDTDMLVCYNGDELKIDSVQIEYAESAVQTYNFEVEGNHNYYVGDGLYLVHNKCAFGVFAENPRSLWGKSADEVRGGNLLKETK